MFDGLPRPAPMSLAWDFFMYNVSSIVHKDLVVCVWVLISFNVVV